MSLRLRIFLAFALLAVLPALPVTWAVQNLIDKSFDVGLSPAVQEGLEGGAETARRWLREQRTEFRDGIDRLAADGGRLAALLDDPDAFHEVQLPGEKAALLNAAGEILARRGPWQEAELAWLCEEALKRLPPAEAAIRRPVYPQDFDRASLRAALAIGEPVSVRLLVSRSIEEQFRRDFESVVEAQQLLAGLRLESENLRRGFLYPFLLVYVLVLVLSLLGAWWLSRWLTRRLATLSAGARRIGEGDWTTRVAPAGRDEVGRLIEAFNEMASKLEGQRRRLTDLEKLAAWRQMARSLAHEIKNPLTPITLAVQEIRDRYTGENEDYARFLNESGRIIEDEVESLRRLSREFSEFARTPEMHKLPSDLNALVRDLAALYGSVPVRLELDEKLPTFAFDAEQMRRVLSNLFENALAALADVPEAERSIRIRSSFTTDRVRLEFSDTGPGIEPEIRARIFEPHFTTKGGGMGLGLALVHSVLTLHGGGVELGEGPGARFLLELPMAEGADRSRSGAGVVADFESAAGSNTEREGS